MAANPAHVEILRSFPMFAHLPVRLLKKLATMSREVTHPSGHVVVRQGAGVHFLHIILSGTATVSADGAQVAQLGPGDFFGEIALLEGGGRTATVTAASELRVLGIDSTSFRRLVQSDAQLAAGLPAIATERLQARDERTAH